MLKIDRFDKFSRLPSPFWYYDMELFERTVREAAAMAATYNISIHYAIKANSERRIVERIAAAGFGAECVSGNEVRYAAECGFPHDKIMFDGCGKTDAEIALALSLGIEAFNVESLPELEVIGQMAAERGVTARVQLRINPNVDAHTHKFITTGLNENKFGISQHEYDRAVEVVKSSKNIDCIGLQFHVGSQIMDVEDVIKEECAKVNDIVDFFESKGLNVRNIDLGGGLGINYDEPDEQPVPDFKTWFRTIAENLKTRPGQKIHVEPGRALVGQVGSLIARVVFVKNGEYKNFLIVDSGMNDLIRPALYGAYHKIENLTAHYVRGAVEKDGIYDVVGPVCESSDVWGEDRQMRISLRGDLIAIRSAGAYGSVMSSNYNMRDKASVIFSDGL